MAVRRRSVRARHLNETGVAFMQTRNLFAKAKPPVMFCWPHVERSRLCCFPVASISIEACGVFCKSCAMTCMHVDVDNIAKAVRDRGGD